MKTSPAAATADARRYLRPPAPVSFPEAALAPESKRHLKLRTLLFAILERAFSPGSSVGSDQFVYWNAADPKRCLAPDVFLRLGVPDSTFGSWKTWERGAPDVAFASWRRSSRAGRPERARPRVATRGMED